MANKKDRSVRSSLYDINESKIGAAHSVIIAARIMDTLEIVPDTELSSNALDVPAPCALVPSKDAPGNFVINAEIADDHRPDDRSQ